FLFQAEDGIRDRNVTGVQTCALPISPEITAFFGLLLSCEYMPNPSSHVTATFSTFPVDLGVFGKALTNPDLVQAGVGVQAGDDQVDEKQVEDYRGQGQDIDPRGLVKIGRAH